MIGEETIQWYKLQLLHSYQWIYCGEAVYIYHIKHPKMGT